jgi:hypothetical protein
VSVQQRQQIADIRKNGFVRGCSAGAKCDDCEKPCGRGWWMRVSYEHDEWDCYCRGCAYRKVHEWDDVEIDENGKYFRPSEAQP